MKNVKQAITDYPTWGFWRFQIGTDSASVNKVRDIHPTIILRNYRGLVGLELCFQEFKMERFNDFDLDHQIRAVRRWGV